MADRSEPALELLSDPDPERARRAMEAMLAMSRIEIAELEAAADGVAIL